MSKNKTMLQMTVEECYHLIAIHCSREAHQVAFLLNQHLNTKLKRERQDLDFQHKEFVAFYPLFHYLDQANYVNYYFVSGKYEGGSSSTQSSGALFTEKETLTTHLMPEYKNVDFFLKIEDETTLINTEEITTILNKVPQIITAYCIDVDTLKSQENLIFN